MTTTNKIKELDEAKGNVTYLLENSMANVDCHGIAYWAERVAILREEIRKSL